MTEKKRRGFKPGQSGNPGGRPKQTEKEKIVKTLTKEAWLDLVEKMLTLDRSQLEQVLAASVPYHVELFIRHALDLGEKPNWPAYDKLLDRLIGKVPTPHEVSGRDGGPVQIEDASKYSDEELDAKIALLTSKGTAPND